MKSYFVFLKRNKLYTAIQVFGLAVALGFVIPLDLQSKRKVSKKCYLCKKLTKGER